MEQNDLIYKEQNKHIGKALLFMLAFLSFFSFNGEFIRIICVNLSSSKAAGETVYEIIFTVFYAASLTVPIFIYKRFDRTYKLSCIPLRSDLSVNLGSLILGGIALNLIAAFINSYVLTLFRPYPDALEQSNMLEGYTALRVIFYVIRLTVIPAVFEEIFFRGFILERLSKFGRFRAIVISSLFFSLAHQNLWQMFYTFILGLFLGFMAFESGSIWGGMILHFLNNGYSVANELFLNTFTSDTAVAIASLVRLIVVLAGVFLLVLYFIRFGKRYINKNWLFETNNELSVNYSVKGVFVGENIIYISICVFLAVLSYGLL